MKKKSVAGLIMGIFFVCAVGIAQATTITIDVWEMFPDMQGENGFYALAYNPSTQVYRELNDGGSEVFNTPQTYWGAPAIRGSYNNFIRMWSSGTNSNWGGPEDAILAYVVPETTTYQISGSYFVNSASGNGMYTYVRDDSSMLWGANLDGQTSAFDLSVDLIAGDRIMFGVNSINNNSFSELNDGATLSNAMISYQDPTSLAPVPEPGTMLHFGIGIAALAGARFKRKKHSK